MLISVWYFAIAFFFIGYFVLDGFDFGVGTSLVSLSRSNVERRVLINTIGPVWDMNETWIIVGMGSLFAAFPLWYATILSAFYLPFFLILIALILRGVSFEYRHLGDSDSWRRLFDTFIVAGSIIPSFMWGLIFGNLLQGLFLDNTFEYVGGISGLLRPFPILCSFLFFLVFTTHGLFYLSAKTTGNLAERARKQARIGAGLTAGTTFLTLLKFWADQVDQALIVGFAAVTILYGLAVLQSRREKDTLAFFTLAGAVFIFFLSFFAALYPALVTASNSDLAITAAMAASKPYTLTLISWLSVFLVPLVIAYQGYSYWVFRRRISTTMISSSGH